MISLQNVNILCDENKDGRVDLYKMNSLVMDRCKVMDVQPRRCMLYHTLADQFV